MEETKKWYESKGVLGGFVTILVIILGAFGYTISPEDQKVIIAAVSAIVATGSSLVGVYGRVKATKKIQ